MNSVLGQMRLSVLILAYFSLARPAAQFLIVGNDEKFRTTAASWCSRRRERTRSLSSTSRARWHRRIVASLPLTNSVFGPPVNLAITPDERLAIVANSVNIVPDDKGGLNQQPDHKLYVIDLKADPPKLTDTLHIGKQSSGLSINPKGELAARREPRGQVDQRAVDLGHRRQAHRHGGDGRLGRAHRLHARRQARARGQVPGAQDRAPRSGGAEGLGRKGTAS